MKICQTHTKRGTPKRLIIANDFEEKWMLELKKEKGELRKCNELLTCLKDVDDNDGRREMTQFLILSMAAGTAIF